MYKRIILFCTAVFLLFVIFGCDKINLLSSKKTEGPKETPSVSTYSVKGTVIAKVNNMPITLEDLNQEIEVYNNMVGSDRPEAKITTSDQKVNYLKNEMIRRALLYQYALKKGIEKKDEIRQALEKTKEDLLVVELVREEAENVDVSAAEIEDYYNTYKEQLKEPEERQIREIAVKSEADAKQILILLLQGQDFATLAKEKSVLSSAKDGGDLGYIAPGKKFAKFDTAAFSDDLDIGEASNIIKGEDGYYYIIKLEGKRGGKQKSLSELWDDIKKVLTFVKQQQKIEGLINQLQGSTKIEIYEGDIK
jgi:parvulin-like peptidyl-prolyl isomerase